MHNKRQKKLKGGKRRKNHGNSRFPRNNGFSSAISRNVAAPDQMDVPLRFRSEFALLGVGLGVRSFTPNAAFDVDPLLGSTETYGFDEYAALYSYYRVISYSYDIRVTNCNTTTPSPIYVLNTNTDPSLAGTRFDLYSTNPHCKTDLLAPHPGARSSRTFKGRHQVSTILGAAVVEYEDNYRSLTTAVPADLVWLTIAAETIAVSGGTSSVNLGVIVDVVMNVRFYGREVDLTLSAMIEKKKKFDLARKQRALSKESSTASH